MFNQSNCDLKTNIKQFNGKLNHVNKIKGLKQFTAYYNIVYEPSNVASLTDLLFNAYARGLFDADGTIYIRAGRQTINFNNIANSDHYWLAQKISSTDLRITMGFSGHAHLIEVLGSLNLPISHSKNKVT